MYDYIVLFEPKDGQARIAFKTNDFKEAQAFCLLDADSLHSRFKDGSLTIYKARETYRN